MKKLIEQDKSIIVACDVSNLETLKKLVLETMNVSGIGGYKVGAVLAIKYGLPQIVALIRRYTPLPIIYDHQKGGTDIPDLGRIFIKTVKNAGVDALILFPFGGCLTLKKWVETTKRLVETVKRAEITILIGGQMTQAGFLEKDGGFVANQGPERIYRQAARLGVKNFVVPGNRLNLAAFYRRVISQETGDKEVVFYAPGFGFQKGEITEADKVLGNRWHPIIGRSVYQAEHPAEALKKFTSLLKGDRDGVF